MALSSVVAQPLEQREKRLLRVLQEPKAVVFMANLARPLPATNPFLPPLPQGVGCPGPYISFHC